MLNEVCDTSVPDPLSVVSDWYIPERNPRLATYYPGGQEIPAEWAPIVLAMADLSRSQQEDDYDFVYAGRTFRGHRIHTIAGIEFAIRAMPMEIPSLEGLRMPTLIQRMLLHESLCAGGLVLVAGATGQGKSTTCAATVVARLKTFGGFCLTIENPPEQPLHGRHGQGRCLQCPVPSSGFAVGLEQAMRAYPAKVMSMLLVGEVRDGRTATNLLQASVNGHLVLTTMHATNIIGAIQRLASLASAVDGIGEMEARALLANSLRLVIHQRIEDGVLKPDTLWSGSDASAVAARIRAGSLEQLNNDIKQQKVWQMNNRIPE